MLGLEIEHLPKESDPARGQGGVLDREATCCLVCAEEGIKLGLCANALNKRLSSKHLV
jgi:hypothetical protein